MTTWASTILHTQMWMDPAEFFDEVPKYGPSLYAESETSPITCH